MIQYVAVLPAYAGMFLGSPWYRSSNGGSPRVCGDVSDFPDAGRKFLTFSPRMRGCFQPHGFQRRRHRVLPAYAGMFLANSQKLRRSSRSPRVCGDVSVARARP